MAYEGLCIYDLKEETAVDYVSEEQAEKELKEYDEERYVIAEVYRECYKVGNGAEDHIETYKII